MKPGPSILVVDDQLELANAIKQALEYRGYRVLTAHDGLEALAVLETEPVDLILTDIAMPNMNGYQLYERIVEDPKWVTIPFVFLTARGMNSDIRYGKELGVDDYLIKPFQIEDLLAVVRGRLRRAQQVGRALSPQPVSNSTAEADILTLGHLQIDPDRHHIWHNRKPVRLSAREFKLLKHLAQHTNKVIPTQALVQVTHDLDTDPIEAGVLIRPLIRSLRRKLGYSAGEMGCIENIRGAGYKLVAPDQK